MVGRSRRRAWGVALLLLGVPFVIGWAGGEESPREELENHVPAITSAVANVSLERLYTSIYDLQNFSSRHIQSPTIGLAYQYIYDAFAANPRLQVAYQNFTYQGIPVSNILAVLPGVDPANRTLYVIGGHMDSTTFAANRTTAAPGADDDGSGTAAVIEAARVLSDFRFNATILFITFTAEESGLIGSDYCASCLAAQFQDVGLMINLDMIAHDPTNASRVDVTANAASEWAADLALAQIADYGIGLVPTKYVNPAATNSDHASFWSQGYPAIFFSETDFSPEWHLWNDTIDKLNMNFATNVTQAAVATLAEVAGILPQGPGTLFFDRAAYGLTSTASVVLYDADLNTNPVVAEGALAWVQSPQEPAGEPVSLTETGPDTAVFTGALPLGTAPSIPGELQVAAGATLLASYADASPPATRTATAFVDGTFPALQNVAVVPGVTGATIFWDASKPTDGNVTFGPTAALGASEADPRLTVQHRIDLSGLQPDTTYYFDVRSSDAAGQMAVADNGGAHYTFHTLAGISTMAPLDRVGFVRSTPPTNFLGSNRFLAGYGMFGGGSIYRGAAQFDTSGTPLPPGATVTATTAYFFEEGFVYTAPGLWDFRVLNESVDAGWTTVSYTALNTTPVDFSLPPTLANADMRPGTWRSLSFPTGTEDAVAYRVGTGALSLRFDGPTGPSASLYQWDSGYPPGCPEMPVHIPRLEVLYSLTGDRTGPMVTALAGLPNPTRGAGATAITATLSDASTGGTPIANAEFFLGSDPGVGRGTPIRAADGGFDAITEDGTYLLDISGVPTGIYWMGVRARDRAGNWGPANTVLLYVGFYDLAYPELAVVDSPDPATQGTTVTITATVTDDVAVAEVWLNVTRPTGALAFNASLPGPGPDYVDARTYTDAGTWGYLVWAVDTSGRWNWSQGSFTIQDVLGPTIAPPVATPDPAEYPTPTNITATITDLSGVAGALLNVTRPDGQWIFNYTMDRNGDEFSNETGYTLLGTYTFVIWAMDVYGRWSNATGSFVVQDTLDPAIVAPIAVPDPAEIYTVVNISAEVSDPLLNNLTLRITRPDATWIEVLLGQDIVTGRYYYPFWADTLGVHTYAFNARDAAGNNATAVGSFLVRDTTPPTLVALPDPPVQGHGGNVTVRADARDNHLLATVTVSLWDPLGTPLGTFPMVWDAVSLVYEYTLTLAVLGNYSYTVNVTDVAGNPVSGSGTFASVDIEPPDFVGLLITPRPTELGDSTHFGTLATDNVGVADVTYEVFLGGTQRIGNFTATYNATSGRWELTQAYASGDHTLVVWISDAAGNRVYGATTFSVGSGAGPVADAGPDQTSRPGVAVTFDGGASSDDVGIVRWEWTVTGPESLNGTDPTIAFTPQTLGDYIVTLRVWDAAGREASDTAALSVTETGGGGPSSGVDWWWILLLLLLMILVLVLLLYLWRRHRKKVAAEEARQLQGPPAGQKRTEVKDSHDRCANTAVGDDRGLPPPPELEEIPPPPPDATR